MAQCATSVPRLYKSIIEEVISNIRDVFLDEGVDEQVLQEIQNSWEQRVKKSRATDHNDAMGTQPTQQMQQAAHQQVASGLAGRGGGSTTAGTAQQSSTPAAAAPAAPQVNLVPVQITVPAQQAGGTAKTITIHVPSSALANGVAGTQLQTILSAPSAAITFSMEPGQAADVIQRQLNASLQRRGIVLPPQLMMFGQPSAAVGQVDGAVDCLFDEAMNNSPRKPTKTRSRKQKVKSVQPNELESAPQTVTSEAHTLPATSSDTDASEAHGTGTAPTQSTVTQSPPDVSVSVDRILLDQVMDQRLLELQVDGPIDDTSDEMSLDEDDDDDKDEDDDKDKPVAEDDDEDDDAGDVNEDPLNSADDLSDDDSGEAFETDNVVVCQYDKITRVRNKWRFNLKDGIMNLKGKDYVFLKATGEGEW